MGKSTPALAKRERQIMEIIHARGEATVTEVQQALPDPPSYSAVRAVMRILEEKGHLRHKEKGKQYVYLPTTSQLQASRSALRHLLSTFFAGSIEKALLTHLTDPKARLTEEEAQRLTQLIREARERGE
jgi:predicted transcriptional regulator